MGLTDLKVIFTWAGAKVGELGRSVTPLASVSVGSIPTLPTIINYFKLHILY